MKDRRTYRQFVEAHLKLVVFLPQIVDSRHGHSNRPLIDGADLVHLLLIFPTRTANIARRSLDELNIVLPNATRLPVHANRVEHKLVRLSDCLSGDSGGVVIKVVAAADVVEVDGE